MIEFFVPPQIIGACGVGLLLAMYYYSQANPAGGVREWVDRDFPEIVHTPKPTWLTGFRYKCHGIDAEAKLETPVFLDYAEAGHLGTFRAKDNVAWNAKDKEQTAYDFGMVLDQLVGGQVAMTVISKRLSIIEIEPIIEDNADVTKSS